MTRVKQYRWLSIILTLLICSLFYLSVRSCGETSTQSSQKEDSVALRVGVDLSPMDFRLDMDGNFSGIQYELLTLMLPDTMIKWHPFASRNDALEALSSGQIDIYATSFAWSTNKALESVTTTKPLYVSGFALVHRPDSLERPWTDAFHDLKEIPIHIPESALDVGILLKNLQEFSYPNIVIIDQPGQTAESLCLAVKNGEIDYAVCDRNTARAINDRIGGLVVESGIAFDLYQVWLLDNHRSELCQVINSKIETMQGTDSWNSVLKRYGLPIR
ncbi:transporter substrate-binding domain-containing protein [Porphyromonas sp.]|uniref:transporter substrate-binding domain-containing protein n=1 Tax=Porphyromonas sp. TaxID=1924944 RepID=UPI0026DB2FFB|nr:transporter substrate-binding domain-containing protein [Porphyromonas sp.]MDO4695778.1 transporter substrate-binding domain-containing protein [Porphyromonas sp.]MDO4771543.1 transporter substrate-binding domain-containing protein [Porphyromonas sp.]